MKNLILGIVIPLLGSLTLFSCQKDAMSEDFSVVSEDLMLQKSEESINKDADALTMKCPACKLEQMRAFAPDCAEITVLGENSFPRTIIIDYGDGCQAEKGPEKKGKIIITVSDEMMNLGAERKLTFENFFIGERKLSGTRTLTNITKVDAVAPLFAYQNEIEIYGPKGGRQKSAEGTRQWIEGFETLEDKSDDVFEIHGTASATCSSGEKMSRVVIEPILVDQACGYPVAGILEISRKGKMHSIDFGDGSCDNEAVLYKENAESVLIDLDEMKMHKRARKR